MDENTYGFSLADATELVNSIGSSERGFQEAKPRQQYLRLIELTEVLYACEDPYSDPLPTAIAKFIIPSTGGGRELSDISIEVSNIGNVAFDEGTIGYVIFTCGFQQFVPLDCPDPSSSSISISGV
jgi:hypothetical protein